MPILFSLHSHRMPLHLEVSALHLYTFYIEVIPPGYIYYVVTFCFFIQFLWQKREQWAALRAQICTFAPRYFQAWSSTMIKLITMQILWTSSSLWKVHDQRVTYPLRWRITDFNRAVKDSCIRPATNTLFQIPQSIIVKIPIGLLKYTKCITYFTLLVPRSDAGKQGLGWMPLTWWCRQVGWWDWCPSSLPNTHLLLGFPLGLVDDNSLL